ncbi:response regulator [Alteromonas portus]|uniref:histidine kinase n=1 Tax=Alteromonas portus TaxID=2565549 RepID=A0A4U0Z8A9_9ALTE|nr:ATP-binding protein [Alteromonas portus]TKB01909.1 response regulator [Alteromonas portus]
MATETAHRYLQKTYSCVLILLVCLLIVPKVSQGIGLNLEGRTSFDGIPSGVIRDIEVSNRAVYIAAENGVFEVIGKESERLQFNTSTKTTGIISDIHLVGTELWVVEYGVGVFRVNLRTKEAEQFFADKDWSNSVWAMTMTSKNLYFSIIDNVIQTDRVSGNSTKLNSRLSTLTLNGVYSLFAEKDQVHIASNKGYVAISETHSTIDEYVLRDKLPMLSSATFIKVIDNELYIGGPEGLYILGSKERYIPTEGVSGTYINDVIKTEEDKIWVSDGRLLILEEDELLAPPFMSPILTSEAIRSVTKIAVGPHDSLLIASSQLGLITLPRTKSSTNLVSFKGSVLRDNIQRSVIGETETLVRIENGLYAINESNGELSETIIGKDLHCTSWQEDLFARLVELEPSDLCNRDFIHSVEVHKGAFYFYFDDGTSANYYFIQDEAIKDIFKAPRKIVYSALLSGGELAAFDVFDDVHFQLSKFNWRTVKAEEGNWFGLQCLVELENAYLLCTSGAGLKQINKKSGLVNSTTIQGLDKLRFIRGAIVTESGNLWVASNMGLFIKPRTRELAFNVGRKYGLFDTDFEYKSFDILREKVLVKGDKYSYLLDENTLISSLEILSDKAEPPILTYVKWLDEKGQHIHYFPETLDFYFDNSFEEVTFNFVISDLYDENAGVEFKLDDDAWVSHNRTAMNLTLGDIDVGSHTLKVASKHNEDASKIVTIQFEIAPPFWTSYLAITLYLAILIVLFFLWKVGIVSKLYEKFQSTTLYAYLTRYEITDGHSKFEKMLRSKERFINEITSELRTPIQVINGSLEKISDADIGARKELICVQDNMKRVEQLINQMSQNVPTAFKAEDYYKSYSPENIRFIVLSLEPLAKQKRQNLEVRIKVKKEVSLISGSLEKIVANLVQNAIKFTPELGTIKVSAIQDSKALKIIVNDDGEGIEENLQSKVFERFARGNTKLDGNGVGLATVKTLVELNQGEIALQSQKGIGTKVSVTLPVDDIAFVNSHAEDLLPADAKTNKKSLLIVDDSREFRSYLFDLFSEKYRCLVARNGVQALDVMQHYLVDLVITDQMMHEMDGLGLTRAIRQNPSYANIPILMLTAETGAELEKAALEEKVDYFLAKPASNEEIILRVEHLLSVREAKEKEEDESALPVFKFGCLIIPEFDNEKDMAFYLNFIAVLEKNYQDEAFNRDQAASQLLISPRSLNRRMSELFEYNFSEFLSRFRIEKSIPLLLEGNSILDTCLDVGFGTAAYFSTSFKKVMHLPPKKYIEQYSKTVA